MVGAFRQWAARSYVRTRELGWEGLDLSLYLLNRGLWRFGSRLPVGRNVFEEDWDVLAILDGCRVDLLEEVAPESDVVDDVDSVWSVGSTSTEWIENTFDAVPEDEDVWYVTANPFAADHESLLRGCDVDHVWQYGFDDDLGTVPPRTVTDRAISVAREAAPDRLVVHYMQPHHPFVGERDDVAVDTSIEDIVGKRSEETTEWEPGDRHRNNVWYKVRRGEVSFDAVWEAYRSNLRLVLEEAELLSRNVSGDLVLTADHGNATGELGMWGHPMGFLHPSVRRVPWVRVEATDTGSHAPETYDTTADSDRMEQLRALGYR